MDSPIISISTIYTYSVHLGFEVLDFSDTLQNFFNSLMHNNGFLNPHLDSTGCYFEIKEASSSNPPINFLLLQKEI